MIMPYGRKPTQVEAGHGAPGEIDFNALWDRAYAPMIEALGYDPVRADQDTGALIINQMIERLYFADLVLADITIPNGNVYYEIGVRHAAKERGCVLLAADWSKQLFDVTQMRTLRYPLPEGVITDATAKAAIDSIREKIGEMARGISPVNGSIKGFPFNVDETAASTMKNKMMEFSSFQGEIRAVRALPRDARMSKAKELVEKYWKAQITSPTALALLRMLKDSAEKSDDWGWITGFISKLPNVYFDQEEIRELEAFALSNAGRHNEAIAKLEALIEQCGPTPERLGILGGRYKRLLQDAKCDVDKAIYLNKSIDCYERGMELDLNEYYCSCNLPRLYQRRKRKGDTERAQSVLKIVIAACERAKKRGVADEWLRPTLLGAAFDDGDCDKAEELAALVLAEGAARWKIETTLNDLKASAAQVADQSCRNRLTALISTLEQSIEPNPPGQ
jgi:hypothetical protein